MIKEPAMPDEVFLIVFFGSIASIVILVGILKIAYFWRRKKDHAVYRIPSQKTKDRKNSKRQGRRKR